MLRLKNEGDAQQPKDEGDERRRRHYQQRQMCDQLKLLRSMAVAGIVRRAGERMRVNIGIPIDIVGMGKQRNRTPVPCEEYQKQYRTYISVVFPHFVFKSVPNVQKTFKKQGLIKMLTIDYGV